MKLVRLWHLCALVIVVTDSSIVKVAVGEGFGLVCKSRLAPNVASLTAWIRLSIALLHTELLRVLHSNWLNIPITLLAVDANA